MFLGEAEDVHWIVAAHEAKKLILFLLAANALMLALMNFIFRDDELPAMVARLLARLLMIFSFLILLRLLDPNAPASRSELLKGVAVRIAIFGICRCAMELRKALRGDA